MARSLERGQRGRKEDLARLAVNRIKPSGAASHEPSESTKHEIRNKFKNLKAENCMGRGRC